MTEDDLIGPPDFRLYGALSDFHPLLMVSAPEDAEALHLATQRTCVAVYAAHRFGDIAQTFRDHRLLVCSRPEEVEYAALASIANQRIDSLSPVTASTWRSACDKDASEVSRIIDLKLAHSNASEEWIETSWAEEISIEDFLAYLPEHKYLYRPTRTLWPASAINGRLPPVLVDGKSMTPSAYLDRFGSVEQFTWHPAHSEVIKNKLVFEGGWVDQKGVATYNLYRAPEIIKGDARAADRWRDHLHHIYPDEAEHLEKWLAHRLQKPGEKINHGIVLGGEQGIGKDSILEPIKRGIGPWNFSEVSPKQMLGNFNPWVRAVVLRISEGHDLGDIDRFKFYDHCKAYLAAPPDVLCCNRKHLHEVPTFNVMGVILTTNHRTDGVYLPPDDRRHYVAWSEIRREQFSACYWTEFWSWLNGEGTGHVCAYLRGLDLSKFDPKAPPPKTPAWHAIVSSNIAPEDNDLAGLIEILNRPEVIHVQMLVDAAENRRMLHVVTDLTDRSQRKRIPHRLERIGYSLVANPDAKDGVWKLDGKRVTLYGHRDHSSGALISEARELCRKVRGS